MKRHLLSIVLCITVCGFMQASEPDSVMVDHFSSWQLLNVESWKNAALHGQAYPTDYSDVALSIDYSRQNSAFVLQEGKGHTLFNICATTYLRLSDNTAVWGNASYRTGAKRGIRFNSVADYELLQPYILADTDGGKTKNERYTIEGGYGTKLNRWLLGGEVLFRAEHEYRTYDPRIRAIVTDLTLRAGAAYEAADYRWGAAGELNIYKQTDDVKFMRELGNIPEYQLTGHGTVYARFSGEVNNLYYKGGGFTLRLNAIPSSGNGMYANVDAGKYHYERIAASYNSLPLTKLYREEVHAEIGWKQQAKAHLAVFADMKYTRRLGDENIVGSSLSNNFPILTTLTMYKNNIYDASLNAVYGQLRNTDWHIWFKTGYLKNNEQYVTPKREIDYSRFYTELRGQLITNIAKQTTISATAHGAFIKNLDSKMNIPVVNTEPALLSMLDYNYRYIKAHYTLLNASLRAHHRIKKTPYGVFAEIAGATILSSEKARQTQARLSLGFTF